MASNSHIRSHSRTPSNSNQVYAVHRSRSPSVNSEMLPISRTPSPHVRNNSMNNSNKPLPTLPLNPVPTPPPPGMSATLEVIAQRTTELHERLPRGQPTQVLGMPDSSPAPSMHSPPQPKVPNAYYLKRKISEPDAPQAAHLALPKNKPVALNLPPSASNHGFPEDPNRPISQRPFSQHYPWPYDPSSYYNMARSPTVSIHPKPKAYPVGWEESGGLSRPVSMGGIDLPIPLSPIPVVPTIPEQYRKGVAIDARPEVPEHRVVYDHERDGLGDQISEKAMLKQQQKSQRTEQQQKKPAAVPAQDPNEYIPEASTIESLAELWEFAAHGKLLSHRVQPKMSISSSNLSIPGGVYVLNMYRGAPLNAQQPDLGGFAPEHFAFGPTPSNPFYTIQALPDALHPNNPTIFNPNDPATFFNDLLILRRNPVTHKDTSVLTMGLNPHAAKSHRRRLAIAANGTSQLQSPTQGDELITLIYPKQAAMMAIDSSSIHVDDKTGRIVGGDAQTMAREAVERAAETECCRLSWDVTRDRYYLYHPGIGHGGEVYLVIIDDGNYTKPKTAEPSPGVGFDIPGTKGSIKLINVDTSEAIVVLDFKSGLLFVNTMATRKIPSLYIVDVAVSTVLAVAVVEGRRIQDKQHFLLSSMQSNDRLSNGSSHKIGGTSRDVKHPGGGITGGGWSDSTLGASFTDGTQVNGKGNGGAGGKGGTGYVVEGKSSGRVLDLAGMIMNGLITIIAWIIGLFWAIGSGIGKIFGGKKKRDGDVERGMPGTAYAHGNQGQYEGHRV